MNKKTKEELKKVVEYGLESEQTHYDECEKDEQGNHIYKSYKSLAEWLKQQEDNKNKVYEDCLGFNEEEIKQAMEDLNKTESPYTGEELDEMILDHSEVYIKAIRNLLEEK